MNNRSSLDPEPRYSMAPDSRQVETRDAKLETIKLLYQQLNNLQSDTVRRVIAQWHDTAQNGGFAHDPIPWDVLFDASISNEHDHLILMRNFQHYASYALALDLTPDPTTEMTGSTPPEDPATERVRAQTRESLRVGQKIPVKRTMSWGSLALNLPCDQKKP
jgi:hypothetical protein